MGVANIVLRAAQLVVSVTVLGLAAYVTWLDLQVEICIPDAFGNPYCTYAAPSSSLILLLFNSVWSLLAVAALLLLPLCIKPHPIAVAVLDGLTMVFWFSGAVAYTVEVAQANQYLANLAALETGSASNPGTPILDAICALAFILWLLFLASFIINVRGVIKGRSSPNHDPSAPPGPAGPNNFPQQASHAPQSPSSPSAQGTYVQPLAQQQPPMQQHAPMQSPVQQPQQPVQPEHMPPQYMPQKQPLPNELSAAPAAPPAQHNPHIPGGGDKTYLDQNPELAHV